MPTDTKPHRARQAKSRRRIRKIGSLEDARRKLRPSRPLKMCS